MAKSAAFFSPAFRSRRFGHRHLRASHVIKIGLATLIGPAAILMLVGLPFLLIGVQTDNAVLLAIGSTTGLAVMSPFFGIFAVPIALLSGAWAMRFGVAGWGIALLASCCLPVGIGALFQWFDPTTTAIRAMLLLTPIVVLHAAVLWCATRWICPDALQAPQTA